MCAQADDCVRRGVRDRPGTTTMATILEFRCDTERVPVKATTRRRRRSAEIVIFPGVRYERIDDPPATSARSNRRIERDTLKLVD